MTADLDPPACSLRHRERSPLSPEHPMDSYDYNPIQVITGQPLGWYSGDDGESARSA
jgi:hypothetical protein